MNLPLFLSPGSPLSLVFLVCCPRSGVLGTHILLTPNLARDEPATSKRSLALKDLDKVAVLESAFCKPGAGFDTMIHRSRSRTFFSSSECPNIGLM